MLRLLGWLFGFAVFVGLIGIAVVGYLVWSISQDLPDYTVLKNYTPPITTRVYASDGSLLAEFARERRLFQPIETVPKRVVEAFISIEDKNFFTHGGIAFDGILRALRDNFLRQISGKGGPLVGASTITQQVAKNFLLTRAQTWDRKIREALLAIKIEKTFSKEKILELYLNQIFFGFNSYGIAAAAMNYFDKALYELTLSETAYLAALPKGPANYDPFRKPAAAIERRNLVLTRMFEEGYITAKEEAEAKSESLNVVPRRGNVQVSSSEYFNEEVRRKLLSIYGEDKLYGGGLSVRTTLDPRMQKLARAALMKGLINFDRSKGFRKPEKTIEVTGDWGTRLYKIKPLWDVPEWKLAVVLEMERNQAKIGLRPTSQDSGAMSKERVTGKLPGSEVHWVKQNLDKVLKVGDVIYVTPVKGKDGVYTLEQVPGVNGALVAMDPRTGRVLAMVGGFSYAQSEFNRATQAMRQPGSAFKPVVYSAALDNGYTPASVVLDAPLEIINQDGSRWRPANYSEKFYGPQTLRRGIERSRNVMTVRLAQDIGMPLVAEYARLFGVYDNMLPVLSMALGAGETTDMRLTAAFATIANGGRKIVPTLIDRIQDRYGKTIFKHDQRLCDACSVDKWENQPEPLIIDNSKQILDPMTAYQITSMLEGVVKRGTARSVQAVGRPVAGKTGTSSDYKDAWFLGFTPELTVGVYVGYDTPKRMGRSATGGGLAAPIFTDFVKGALAGTPPTPFSMPAGMTQVWIDPATGVKAIAGGDAILEAFKPGTGPNLITSVIGVDSNAFLNIEGGNVDVNTGRGGLF